MYVTLELCGGHAGKTITLNGHSFIKGRLLIDPRHASAISLLESCYQAFDVTSDKYQDWIDTHGTLENIPERGEIKGEEGNDPADAPAPDGERHAKTDSREAGTRTAWDGNSPGSGAVTPEEAVTEEAIRIALHDLDPANNVHWTSAGLPSVSIVSKMLGTSITRAMLVEALPGFKRPTQGL